MDNRIAHVVHLQWHREAELPWPDSKMKWVMLMMAEMYIWAVPFGGRRLWTVFISFKTLKKQSKSIFHMWTRLRKRSTKHCRNACSPSICFVETIHLDQWLLIMIPGIRPPAFYQQRHSPLTSWYDRTPKKTLNPNLTSVTHEKVLSKMFFWTKSPRSCCLVSVQYSLSFNLWFCLQQSFGGILLAAKCSTMFTNSLTLTLSVL